MYFDFKGATNLPSVTHFNRGCMFFVNVMLNFRYVIIICDMGESIFSSICLDVLMRPFDLRCKPKTFVN